MFCSKGVSVFFGKEKKKNNLKIKIQVKNAWFKKKKKAEPNSTQRFLYQNIANTVYRDNFANFENEKNIKKWYMLNYACLDSHQWYLFGYWLFLFTLVPMCLTWIFLNKLICCHSLKRGSWKVGSWKWSKLTKFLVCDVLEYKATLANRHYLAIILSSYLLFLFDCPYILIDKILVV